MCKQTRVEEEMATAQVLTPEYVKLAKEQLGENAKDISAHVEALRRWLSSMSHITCPTGTIYLIEKFHI